MEATDACIHEKVETPECAPDHSSPSCPWCIVRNQGRKIAELQDELSAVYDMATEITIRIANWCNPRLREERECRGSEESDQGETVPAKRTRALRSRKRSTEPAGSGDASADTAGDP